MNITLTPTQAPKKFVWVTQDFSGLGFAKHFQEEGNEVLLAYRMKEDEEKPEEFGLVGDGVVEKIELDELMENRADYKDWYFIWDQNHNYEDADLLRSEGFKVLGGSELNYKMEHDRQFGQDLVAKAGLDTPETHEFTSIDDGIAFLEEREDEAFVFKPDESDGAYTTYVPDNENDHEANEELRKYMENQKDASYVLQKRINGLEYNVEAWVYQGKPFFAFCTLESKRKLNKDEGEMVGCSQDVAFTIPLDSKIVQDTLIKLLTVLPPDYTGFIDMNLLVKDNKNYFLEFCARFGYNSHPNLFWNLMIDPQSDILADFLDGKIENFYERFRKGFGASVSLYIDHPMKGAPFEKEHNLEGHFFHFDSYWDGEGYRLAGYANEVGIVCAHGWTIKEAAEECLRLGNKIHYPMHAMRTDLDKNDYPSAPIGRYEALENMGYLNEVKEDNLEEKLDSIING